MFQIPIPLYRALRPRAASSTAAVLLAVLLAGGSSRAMLASARFLVSHLIALINDR